MNDIAQFVVVGIGEVLWDLLPTGTHLGGAPANFAYMAAILGARACVATRVGEDVLGARAIEFFTAAGIDIQNVQKDSKRATGTTIATIEEGGTARYSITEDVAWDYFARNPDLVELAARADAVCFGTLAQRTDESRRTVRMFLEHTRPGCLRVFDANLRSPFWNRDILVQSLQYANVVKLNEEELPIVLECSSLKAGTDVDAAHAIQERWGLLAACITRGPKGSVIATSEGTAVHTGHAVQVIDTVGAGDAFTAAMTICLLRNKHLERVSDAANAVASWLVSKAGAMPGVSSEERAYLRDIVVVQQNSAPEKFTVMRLS